MSETPKEAALVIWQPDRAPGVKKGDEASRYRKKAVIQAMIAFSVGGLVWYFWSRTVGTVALCAGAVILTTGMLSPTVAFRAINRVVDGIAIGVGKASSYILLGPAFYLLFTPLGLLLRRGKNDKLARALDPAAETYWTEVESPEGEGSISAFERQS